MKVYGLIVDGGDGSASIHWLTDKAEVDRLLADGFDDFHEEYTMNEGYPAVTLDLPEGVTPEAIGLVL